MDYLFIFVITKSTTAMNNQDILIKRMREIARTNPESIRVIETKIAPEVQIEFFESLSKCIDNKEYYEPNLLYNELNNNNTLFDRKKEILSTLTISGDVAIYRMIEKYLKETTDESLKAWSYLAYKQAEIFLEAKLTNESNIYIASGLGGLNHRLRYSFVLAATESKCSNSQKNIISGELEYFIKKNDGIIENIEFEFNYTICTCLVPIYIDIVDLIKIIIFEINIYGNFLQESVFITNEKLIEKKDLNIIF